MFYELIKYKRNQWLQSQDCTIRPMLQYIEQRGMMRDAQIEAIKTYLFLKIACKGLPLYQLFSEGYFNNTEIYSEELTVETRQILDTNKAALALFQYSRLKDKNNKQLAPELERFIRHHATEIDYEQAICDIFYGVTYADYLFSLPMGAGKTFLMAAIIYIDLYFAQNEPENPVWAHNFLILAPSALKSSIMPSLRSILEFDPSWIFSEVEAAKLKRLIQFEVLDEQKSANKSNIVKNPNAQKINNHLRGDEVMGIVAVTNAEKVILDRLDSFNNNPLLFGSSHQSEEELKKLQDELRKITIANELRNIIGQMPHLSVFIDEVHHATDSDIKLRQVVTKWATESKGFCNVLGFSGTPYLDKAEKTTIGGNFVIKNTNISNVVYYYPLIDGIDNFLKRPIVKFAESTTEEIVRNGVREFLDKYKDTVYADGTCAKLAIYCGQIAPLEETVYPLVSEIVTEYGLNPAEVVLKRHNGNKQYLEPEGSGAEFANLNSPLSRIRIVLLAQIGKEGWDCKSLTGVILPHEGVCPNNMVLQTSCRCMRQVIKGQRESALIWLNRQNADKLNKELKQQQNITLKDFAEKPNIPLRHIERYSRMNRQQVPPIDFYQLRVIYKTIEVESQPDTAARLADPGLLRKLDKSLVTVQDLNGRVISYEELALDNMENQTFQWWIHEIARESFGTLSKDRLMEYEGLLRAIYDKTRSEEYDHRYIRSMIRKAFVPKRYFSIVEEVVPEEASILSVEHLKPLDVIDDSRIYPKEEDVKEILDWDAHPEKGEIPADKLQMIEEMKKMNVSQNIIDMTMKGIMSEIQHDPHPERLQTYHYLPYRFDSNLELGYFAEALSGIMHDHKLEYYFNGDDTLTDFKIQCFRKHGSHWQYDGLYVPDFLVVSRNDDGMLDRICIIETKGEGYAAKFKERLEFMRDVFVPRNNEKYGRERFHFLYIEDTETPQERVQKTIKMINEFFK